MLEMLSTHNAQFTLTNEEYDYYVSELINSVNNNINVLVPILLYEIARFNSFYRFFFIMLVFKIFFDYIPQKVLFVHRWIQYLVYHFWLWSCESSNIAPT